MTITDHLLAGGRGLRFHFLLRRVLQVARLLRLRAQALDAGEHRGAIRRECLTQFRRPVALDRHHVHDVGKEHERDEARLEARLDRRVLQPRAFQRRVLLHPGVQLDDFRRIARAHENLRKELIGVQGDRRQQPVELLG
jgi:hypothetical protein